MKYLTIDDLLLNIERPLLDNLTSENYAILDELEASAISEIEGYIGSKYNIEQAFSKKYNKHNRYLKNVTVDIMMFYLFSRVASGNIPDIRLQKYAKAIEWLEKTAQGKIAPYLPRLDEKFDKRSANITFGTPPKSVNDTF